MLADPGPRQAGRQNLHPTALAEPDDVNRLTATVTATAIGTLAAHCAAGGPVLGRRCARSCGQPLSGIGDPNRVALTFDDGPHPRSTPFFLRELERRQVRATFFLLGSEFGPHTATGPR